MQDRQRQERGGVEIPVENRSSLQRLGHVQVGAPKVFFKSHKEPFDESCLICPSIERGGSPVEGHEDMESVHRDRS